MEKEIILANAVSRLSQGIISVRTTTISRAVGFKVTADDLRAVQAMGLMGMLRYVSKRTGYVHLAVITLSSYGDNIVIVW